MIINYHLIIIYTFLALLTITDLKNILSFHYYLEVPLEYI
jgi:hypothetical protein